MLKINPLLEIDGYKSSHHKMYPKGITTVFSNYTCRSTSRMPEDCKDVVVFGIQYVFKKLHETWQTNFFNKSKEEVCNEAKEILSDYLGEDYDISHFIDLWNLGYLPIQVSALPEGTIVKQGIPLFVIYNTHPKFAWITNFLETFISSNIWKPIHSASIAFGLKKILTKYALETDKDNIEFVNFQGHDFSFRGMQTNEAAISSGMGFLTSFKGTDTIPSIVGIKHYYEDTTDIGYSVPASEHSVMCAHGKDGEIDTLKYLMNQYPKGILSVVSDTWDLWKLVTEYLATLKEEILARDGKLVCRPDSGDPVDIICGTLHYATGHRADITPEQKGVIELLWDIFGGTVNEQGYKVLDPHIGAIYGDSITIERAKEICERLKNKGFASTNVVLGIGLTYGPLI